MKVSITFVGCILGASVASAQTTVVTQTAPPPIAVKVGPATVAPSATTKYTMPAKGPDGGPVPGTQRGSSTSTSVGVTATIPIPEGKKK